jgi:hypothetical protein
MVALTKPVQKKFNIEKAYKNYADKKNMPVNPGTDPLGDLTDKF